MMVEDFCLMAVLVVEEIDSRANSRIVHVSFGMSICFRNSGSLSEALFDGRVASELQSTITIDSFAPSLH